MLVLKMPRLEGLVAWWLVYRLAIDLGYICSFPQFKSFVQLQKLRVCTPPPPATNKHENTNAFYEE